ncbi:MAG: metallophosphoesterase [Alphaproteobacteria bacterium]|nr:metallophosphoesterase [Alphaproteobacteria bacterium]
MFFFIAGFIIATACSVITIKTLVGYSDMKLIYKISAAIVIVLGWFSFIIMGIIRKHELLPLEVYTVVHNVLYTLLGFVFILFVVIMLRDIVWYTIFGIAKLLKIDGWHIDPKNISLLGKANLIVVSFSVLLSIYALYQGLKLPTVNEEFIYSSKVNSNLRIIQLSDLHITRATPVSRIAKIVNQVNLLNPDVVVLTGDTIDDNPTLVEKQLNVLKELSAPYGIYSIMGNHEFYNDVYAAKRALDAYGFKFLFNGGFHINNSNVFIAGIPDLGTMVDRVNFWRTLNNTKKDNYNVLLSHAPSILDSLSGGIVDLVLSGHTHGGQIFPFHIMVKQANGYLAGKYSLNKTDMLISRGVGTWGPPMRLFAPSDITIINLLRK